MHLPVVLLVACSLIWAGMVAAISFVEAPLTFRAPGVTIPIGLGIGRLVFRVLNAVEAVLALGIAGALVAAAVSPARLPLPVVLAALLAVLVLAAQLTAVRPRLNRRSDAVLAGLDAPRSSAHLAYVGLELLKLPALLVAGIGALLSA